MFAIRGSLVRRLTSLLVGCALLSACPTEKNTEAQSTGGASETSAAGSSEKARGMYAQIMGRYAPVGQCDSASSYWEFTPTTVKNGEVTCQIHGMDTLMEQLSIDARQCVKAGAEDGTRLFYIAMPAPNILQLTGSDLQQELERCGMV